MKKVLLIDDEEDLAFFVKSNLELKGDLKVLTAFDGQEGIDMLSRDRPDLIILDIMMPRMDGFEVLKRLKQSQETMDIPVIMLTAKTDPRSLDEGISLGADFYLPKPFELKNLRQFIELTINGKTS